MKPSDSINFEFVLLEHVRRIARASAFMGKKFSQSNASYFTAVNFLEDALYPWFKDYPNVKKQLDEFYAKIDKEGLSRKDYHLTRERFRILLELMTQMGITFEMEATGV